MYQAKETLQLRHQLSASGLSLRAAAYDTRRHQVLTFDSHPLRPHVLRLFSLRRELKSVPLFDKTDDESTTKRHKAAKKATSTSTSATRKRSSFFEAQLQQVHEEHEKRLEQPKEELVVPHVLLQYSPTLDVFVCVYSRAKRPKGSSKVPKATTQGVALFEPATLRRLLVYRGPENHSLQCAHFDPSTDKLVLASHLQSDSRGHEAAGAMLPSAPKNVVEILQLSKRLDDRHASWPAGLTQDRNERPTTLLFVENTRTSLRHPDTLALICASRGLRELYGAVSDCGSASTDMCSALLEWRQSGGKFVLARRVMLRARITAMTLSPCGDWLLAGLCTGGLRVWNVNGSRTNGSALFTIDADPYEPTGPGVADAQAAVLSSIEITTTPTPELTGTIEAATPTDVIVIAAERNTGVVRHWMFSVERKMFEDNSDGTNSGEHRYPRLSLVGKFIAGGKEQIGKDESPGKFKNQDSLGPPLRTLVMCVTIDMGSCFENLLLVVREDVIHVLKVQTVLYVMQEFTSIEEVYSVRAITEQGESTVISLSSTAACKLRIFPLDDSSNPASRSTKQLFITPHTSDVSPHVCSIETVTNARMQISFVVIAWSSGVVDVYDLEHEQHVLKLQDNYLTDQISALSIVAFQRVIAKKSKLPKGDPIGYLSSRSYEDIYQNPNSELAGADTSDEYAEQAPKTLIVVGTETGKLYGWKADALCDGDLSFKSIQKANVKAQAAHSSHIIQIARMDAAACGGRAVLASVAADGIIKLWSVPSLKLIGHVSSAAEGCPSTASCIEIMRGHSRVNGAGNQSSVNVYVIAGYNDGRLATWCVDTKRVSFQRLDVSTNHERRVTKICHIASDVASTGLAEFLSCSLDMTVIQWQILGSGSVQEKRYFDIGTAIIDMVLVKEQAILALAHEVCKFSFAPSSKCDMKYLIKPELIAKSPDADNDSYEADTTSVNDDEYPNTPTTRSVEDPTDVSIQPRQTTRSVDEYLTLHVPSAVLHLEAASSGAVTTATATDSAPATRLSEQDERTFSSWNEMMPRHIRESKSADKFQRRSIDDDVLREYLQDYIARHGSGGTMTANRITHLLALRPELPNVKRPGFALAKSLKDLKLTAQTRVDSEEALQIMRLLLTISTASRPSFDAPTMTRFLKQKDPSNEKVRAQRTREKKQARRKPVVTYNLLGEKYVRWEDVPEDEDVPQNQSPPSPTNNLIVHTPPSPHLREQSGFEGDPLSAEVGVVEPPPLELPSSTAGNNTEVLEDSNEIAEAPTTGSTDTILTSSPLINSSRPHTSEESSEEEEEDDEEEEGEEDSGDNDNEEDSVDVEKDTTPKDQNQVTLERAVTSKAARTTTSATKQRRSKRAQRYKHSIENIFESPLVNGIRLSPMFQQFWTKGYCWCQPAPRLRINWTDPVKAKNDGGGSQKRTEGTVRRSPKCKKCHKRLHTVDLPRVGYAPHFSRQATFDIIVEVYSKLTATAHSRLYKSSSPRKESSLECSIFGALLDVFLATYGMRSAVEMKLKLFFVSMCHYLREYDAVAVFGELLGLHTPEHADEYDQAPSTLVALCVCCYSWLYSRGMIVNGDSFSGRQHGHEWGNTYGAMTTEVTPATDGTTHWQFIRIEHALLCAQDNLLYPLVSPGFLRNIMLFMQEYAQGAPTRLLRTDSPDFSDEATHYYRGPARWIELHRFLRLLVGEWKQQNAQFRVVERLLFVHPQRDAALEGDLLEKLRLMLSCFVFYDHERVGAMAISDFETLLFKLRYLWSEEGVVEQVAPSKNKLFENAIVAIRKRFIDLNHDGQLCYLDFWAMLYIVGVKTRGLIHFHEIPSFCRDYRLEILPELSDMVRNYMELSCTLLLPKGLQVGKSSIDQKAERQHRRRVGGLHDGIFHISKTLEGSLSTQELLSSDDTKKLGLFLDGAAPATRQTASTTALDRFRPVSVEAEFRATSGYSSSRREPVVVGVRPSGPTPKPVAPLRVSVMGGSDLLPGTNSTDSWVQNEISPQTNAWPRDKATQRGTYTNMYIQFPQVSPVCRRVGANEIRTFPATQILGMPMEVESEEEEDYDVSPTQEEPEEMPLGEPPPLDRTHSSQSVVPEEDVASEEPAVEESMPSTPKPILEKRRSATAVVVVPTVETEKSASRTSSRHELLKRPSSRSLQRAVSERIKLEEAAIQLEAEKLSSPPPRQSSPTSPIPTTRKKTSPDSESDADQIVIPRAEPEVTTDIIEASIEQLPQVVEPDEPAPMHVEEIRPEPEPVVQIRVEVVEPAIVQPVVEQTIVAEPLVVDPVVEPTVEPVVLPEPVREVTVIESIEPVVLDEVTPTPVPPEEPAPTIDPEPYPDAESDAASEELPDITTEAEYKPQVIRTEEIQIHRAFRFSQQPTFLHSIAVTNNPYRTAMWHPNDDSESDEEDIQKSSVKKYAASNRGGFDADDPIYSSGDESVTSTRTGTMLNGAKAHKQSGEGETQSSATSPNSVSAHSKDAAMPLKPQASYSQLSRLDSDLQPTLRHRKEKKLNGLDYSYLDDLESIQDEVEDEKEIVTSDPLKPIKRKRLDEDAERALYGERLVSALGEGIAFTPEAEAAMQQKWQQFFNDSESKMFAAMRNELEKKQMEQREAEERQKKLRKKWQEQRDQDLQRLQNSRHNSILMSSATTNSANGAVDASFRLRRIRRESCRQLTEELEFGVSVQRDLKETKDMEFFHFYYLPEGHGSIITLKMHALKGDAEVFMSTDTKVPCSSDFMWRSYERMAKTAGEGHRIILYPHDLLRVVSSATANAAPTEHAAAIVESNASTASLRSFYPKQPDATSLKVGFYLSVVALEPGTTFTLAVMSSGQKMQPSRAIQTVDYLIDRFNMLSRSFQGQSVVPFVSSSSVRAMSAKGSARSEINDRRILSSGNDNGTTEEEGGDDEENGNENEPTEATTKRRKSKTGADERDQKELKSFQHLLETLSEKKGFGSPRAASILLAGPSEEHLEFVQDEDQRLQEMHRILSPPKTCPEGSVGHRDSIAVVTERRLTLQGKRQKLRRVVAARLQKKLAPLRHKSIAGGELEKSASTGGLANLRVAKTAPRPVAYSITSLDPLPRSQRFKTASTPPAPVRRSSVIDKGSSDGAELGQKE